ncbi:ABC transporter substrate-binding protein [Aureimonas sp. SA4125]|uniref:ABC transporter substrate-binding protein n=1 Tax=Aureimonas sp. SA4125 TaxID=2826993 RepID=UPI001CC791B3|nr:ABC transporter substrate-binding protein [Aureimonas sp. SA4125]BDA84863.1 ABC transporter substrate-binding protein [Aureimonas sp. SA4125]
MRLTRRTFTSALAAVAAFGVLAGPVSAKELTKLTYIQEWPVPDGFWVPWILGSAKGFYAEEGIELEIVTPPTVADTTKFLGTGRAQVAFTTVMDVIFAREQQAPVTAIARYGRGNNWGILSPEGVPLTVPELKGKTIGIYNDAWTTAQLTMMLADGGLTMADVQTVAAADDTVPLLLQKKVDAITGITNAEGTGMAVLGNQKASFLAAKDHGVPDTPIFMIAANDDWLKANPEMAKAFLRATRKSIDYAMAHPDEGIAAFTALYSNAYDPKFIAQQWKDTIPLFGEASADMMTSNDADWVSLLAALKKFDVVKAPLEPSAYYTNAYIAE